MINRESHRNKQKWMLLPLQHRRRTKKNLTYALLKLDLPVIFRLCIENKWVKEHYKELRPGYTLPTSQKISGPLLDGVHEEMTTKACEFLFGIEVTLSVDAWSDVNNSPVLASSFIYKEKFLLLGA